MAFAKNKGLLQNKKAIANCTTKPHKKKQSGTFESVRRSKRSRILCIFFLRGYFATAPIFIRSPNLYCKFKSCFFQKSSFGNPNKLMKNVIVSKIRPSVLSNDSGSLCFWRKGPPITLNQTASSMVASSMICSDNSSNSKLCRATAAIESRCTSMGFCYLAACYANLGKMQ